MNRLVSCKVSYREATLLIMIIAVDYLITYLVIFNLSHDMVGSRTFMEYGNSYFFLCFLLCVAHPLFKEALGEENSYILIKIFD